MADFDTASSSGTVSDESDDGRTDYNTSFQFPRSGDSRAAAVHPQRGHSSSTQKPGAPSTRSKLAVSRDGSLHFWRSIIAKSSAAPRSKSIASPTDGLTQGASPEDESMEAMRATRASAFRSHRNSSVGAIPNPLPLRPALLDTSHRDSQSSHTSARTRAGSSAIPEIKPIATGNGVSVGINLTEPVLFLQGYDQNDSTSRNTVMLRGTLHLKVTKSVKIRAINLKFKGTATTKWPEGIPPKKIDYEETDSLMSHTWPFFNAQFATAEHGSCADREVLAGPQSGGKNSPQMSPSASTVNLSPRDPKRMSLQLTSARSFDKSDPIKNGPTTAQKGYRTFHPGDYLYNFELPLDSRLPETINVDLGYVKYELEASVERSGAFKANLFGTKELALIRAPSEGSLEQVEPIAISRNWEDQLHYDIVISGKSFPLGSKIPIAFKLTPLAKVQCHRVKVFITENVEYFCSNKKVHRMEPTRKVLLFEKRADSAPVSYFPGSTMRITAGGGIPYDQRAAAARGENVIPQDPTNLLGCLDGETSGGPTEMEFNVQLPGCSSKLGGERSNQQLNFDTTYQNIQVHHWIKIVMRLSRPDHEDPAKRRHFEISIDSPFHILSCVANHANTALPAYSSPAPSNGDSLVGSCNCSNSPRRRVSPGEVPTLGSFSDSGSNGTSQPSTPPPPLNSQGAGEALPLQLNLARPPAAVLHGYGGNMQRPIHMLRAPSFNPPAFADEEPPPPLVTPPPQYNDIASPTAGHGLADYFTRLAVAYDEDSEDDHVSPGRVRVPLTPGSRVNRSMDVPRGWVPVGR